MVGQLVNETREAIERTLEETKKKLESAELEPVSYTHLRHQKFLSDQQEHPYHSDHADRVLHHI